MAEDVTLEWSQPMTSDQVARYHMTRGFVAVELYEHTERQRKALSEIVSRLPRTADGVPITPGMEVWCAFGKDEPVRGVAYDCPAGRVHVRYDEPIDLTDGGKVMTDSSEPWTGCVYANLENAMARRKVTVP